MRSSTFIFIPRWWWLTWNSFKFSRPFHVRNFNDTRFWWFTNYISRSNNETCEKKNNHPMKNHMNSHKIRSLEKSNEYQTNRDEIITKQLSSIDTFIVIVFTVALIKSIKITKSIENRSCIYRNGGWMKSVFNSYENVIFQFRLLDAFKNSAKYTTFFNKKKQNLNPYSTQHTITHNSNDIYIFLTE